jgi:tRNA (Thr-GGU) A37 N-methylase
MCIVDLIECREGALSVRGLDAIEGTTVLDIKPYMPEIDCVVT